MISPTFKQYKSQHSYSTVQGPRVRDDHVKDLLESTFNKMNRHLRFAVMFYPFLNAKASKSKRRRYKRWRNMLCDLHRLAVNTYYTTTFHRISRENVADPILDLILRLGPKFRLPSSATVKPRVILKSFMDKTCQMSDSVRSESDSYIPSCDDLTKDFFKNPLHRSRLRPNVTTNLWIPKVIYDGFELLRREIVANDWVVCFSDKEKHLCLVNRLVYKLAVFSNERENFPRDDDTAKLILLPKTHKIDSFPAWTWQMK